MHALQFGAGNIGRGFIGKILADAGWKVTFADVDLKVVEALARDGRYPVDVVGEAARQEMVTGVNAITSTGEEVIALFRDVDLVTTAVGPTVLPRIAPTLARGIAARLQAGVTAPLNIIACENAVKATSQLKEAVFAALDPALTARVEALVGFADSAVDRIVPPAHPDPAQPLKVTVEAFSEWIVDRNQLKGWTRDLPGMELTDNLPAFVERKLFTLNTGHAITAYLGALAGKATILEAIGTPAIREVVAEAMRESGAVLIRRYGFEPARHAAYIEKILSRFANPYLHDEVGRVGREPLRKLSPNDRLLRPLLGTLEFGLPHAALAQGVAAALRYRNDHDPQAVDLQRRIAQAGVETTLTELGEGRLPPAVIAEIAALWRRMGA